MSGMHQSRKARRLMRRVFTTPEIFERILLNLDIRELLFAQLVHTHFKSFIEQSMNIQRRLFFVPDLSRTTPELHPILKARFPALMSLERPDGPRYLFDLNEIICKMDWYTDEFYRDRMLREDASWRRMFPVQPPAKLELIKIFSHDTCISQIGRGVPARLGSQYQHLQETGIRMGLLYDFVVHLNSSNCDSEFYVHWQMFPRIQGRDQVYRYYPDEHPGFEALYPNGEEKKETQHSITLYYQHDSCCGGGITPEPLLKIDSPFTSMVEKDLPTLLEFLKDPIIGLNSWRMYLTAEHRIRIKQRNMKRRR